MALWAATEPDPEVSIPRLQLMYELLYHSLLAFCLNAEQLASIQPAGLPGILKSQPSLAVLDVGHLVARALCPTSTDPLAWSQKSASGKQYLYVSVFTSDITTVVGTSYTRDSIIRNVCYNQPTFPIYVDLLKYINK